MQTEFVQWQIQVLGEQVKDLGEKNAEAATDKTAEAA